VTSSGNFSFFFFFFLVDTVNSSFISAPNYQLEFHLKGALKWGSKLFTGAPVNKNLPLFVCLLIRN
jgi:hypothetical protein